MLSGASVLAGSEALPKTPLTICPVKPQDKEREIEVHGGTVWFLK